MKKHKQNRNALSQIFDNFYYFSFPVLLICFGALSANLGAQTSEGPNSASTFSNVAFIGSATNWTNLSNAGSSDDVYTDIPTNGLSSNGDYTDVFQATNFGFSIPSGATINGIIVEIERSDINNAKDNFIGIVKGGSVGSEDKSVNPAWSSETYISYGSSTDLWSETWTVADINASGFGVAISVKKQGGGANPQPIIDHIRITVHYTAAALPIELIDFNTEFSNGNVILDWQTATEINNDYFTIERSTDAMIWEDLLTIQGAGNSTARIDYQAIDYHPLAGTSYYRLKQTDYDGQFERFTIKSIINLEAENNLIKLFPNPARGVINIASKSISWDELSIYSSSGKNLTSLVSLLNHNNERNSFQIDINSLPKGVYFLKFKEKSARVIKL